MLENLDRRDTLILKGLGISAIVLHNFFHLIGPVHENEFAFGPEGFRAFVKSLSTPTTAIEGFFAFFGHFGVELFVFFAAYGLAKSHWDDPDSWGRFLWGRITKLYPAFGLAVLFWFVIMASQSGLVNTLRIYGAKLVWMFTGVSNLIPGDVLPPIGPWWFIPFIIQFYALWHLLRRFTNRFGQGGLLALAVSCLILVFSVNSYLVHWSMSLMATPIGHMPEFCFGIAAARFPVRLRWQVVVAAAAALVLGSMYRIVWPLTYISALILSLAIYLGMRGQLRRAFFLVRIGEYSIYIFLFNGILRYLFIPYATSPRSALLLGCADLVTSIAVAALLQEFLMPRSMADKFTLAGSHANQMVAAERG
jgi:peptidoglycan/LPS O-acetylase OafA/YrhL